MDPTINFLINNEYNLTLREFFSNILYNLFLGYIKNDIHKKKIVHKQNIHFLEYMYTRISLFLCMHV
jgi:hypothetical protein